MKQKIFIAIKAVAITMLLVLGVGYCGQMDVDYENQRTLEPIHQSMYKNDYKGTEYHE